MNQDERRIYLIKYLLNENNKYENYEIPKDIIQQQKMLRALMNVREPNKISDEFLLIQDEYLKQRSKERGIVDTSIFKPVKSNDRLFIYQGDITTLKCDAIVNACNLKMLGCFAPLHDCIDNFIHTYAGIQLRLKMNEIMINQGLDEETGTAKITSGYNLPCKYILHTVGPIISYSVTKEDERLLSSCYEKCLELAVENNIKSIAFCCISTGVFSFPNDKACKIAVDTVSGFLKKDYSIKQVIFNVFKDEDFKLYNQLLN